MKINKIFLSALMVIALSFSALPLVAFAAEPTANVKVKAAPADGSVIAVPTQDGQVATIPVNPGSTTIDLSTGLDSWVGVVVGLLALALATGYNWAKKKFAFVEKLLPEEEFQKLVSPLLDEAVAAGVGKLKNADWLKIETKNEAVAGAVNYALEHGGPLLAKFNVSPAQLREKIEAKLVQNGWDTSPGKWES